MSRNAYQGICYRCGELVEANTGHFERVGRIQRKKWSGRFSGKWLTQHAKCAIKWRGTNRHYQFATDVQPLSTEKEKGRG